jgi:phage gpG-like protein
MRQRLEADMLQFKQRQEGVIMRRLQMIGEEAVNTARTSRRYLDQTGNLTSSIGYVILRRGSIVNKAGFDKTKEGDEGVRQGESLATSLAKDYPHDFALIVVAGMDYAAYVEAKGLGGMTAAELQSKASIEQFVKRFK